MPAGTLVALGTVERMDPAWPPVLIAAVVAVLVLTVTVVAVMFRRLRAVAREQRVRPRGGER